MPLSVTKLVTTGEVAAPGPSTTTVIVDVDVESTVVVTLKVEMLGIGVDVSTWSRFGSKTRLLLVVPVR